MTAQITRTQYKQARRLLRDNGCTPAQTRDAALLLKDRHQFERSHLKEALAEFDRERAQAQRMNGVA